MKMHIRGEAERRERGCEKVKNNNTTFGDLLRDDSSGPWVRGYLGFIGHAKTTRLLSFKRFSVNLIFLILEFLSQPTTKAIHVFSSSYKLSSFLHQTVGVG